MRVWEIEFEGKMRVVEMELIVPHDASNERETPQNAAMRVLSSAGVIVDVESLTCAEITPPGSSDG